jgi:large subunit ribosomal protein L4
MTVQKIVKYKQQDGEIEFKLNVLEDSGNYLIHRDILRHQLSQKQGTVATKTRSEVRGGGKKPWQQKGTGRARAGSSRSPLWRGGGVIFGPKPKTTSLKLNKKERKLAVQTLLYNKLKNTQISIEVDQMLEMKPKTKDFCTALKKSKLDLNQKTLLVVSKKTNYLKKSSQNLKNIELISASNLNTLSLLKAKQILITPLALNEIKEIYCD